MMHSYYHDPMLKPSSSHFNQVKLYVSIGTVDTRFGHIIVHWGGSIRELIWEVNVH